VGWTPPPAAAGPALTGFVVELRTVADPAAVAARRHASPSARDVDFPGQAAGTRYFATVAAVSAAGIGAQRETPTAVLAASATADCASCAAPAAPQPAATRRSTPAASAASPAPHGTAAAAGSQVPVSSGMPLQLALGIGGILIAACLAIAAVLLRRRSALG
jgi:hypothetical protein